MEEVKKPTLNTSIYLSEGDRRFLFEHFQIPVYSTGVVYRKLLMELAKKVVGVGKEDDGKGSEAKPASGEYPGY